MFRRLSVAVVGLAALLTALAFITDTRRTHAPKDATFEERLKQMSTTLEWRGAEEYRMAERYYPDFALSSEDYVQAAHDRDALPPARRTDKGGTATPIGDWHFVGPLDLDVPHNLYNGPGPAVGRVSSVQWGANDDTIYATGPGVRHARRGHKLVFARRRMANLAVCGSGGGPDQPDPHVRGNRRL